LRAERAHKLLGALWCVLVGWGDHGRAVVFICVLAAKAAMHYAQHTHAPSHLLQQRQRRRRGAGGVRVLLRVTWWRPRRLLLPTAVRRRACASSLLRPHSVVRCVLKQRRAFFAMLQQMARCVLQCATLTLEPRRQSRVGASSVKQSDRARLAAAMC
jgi:hypothetical protein